MLRICFVVCTLTFAQNVRVLIYLACLYEMIFASRGAQWKPANARSLRFRFKTFELDWERRRESLCCASRPFKTFAVSHRVAMNRDVVLTLRIPLSSQLPSRNYFRTLVLSAVSCHVEISVWPRTCWLHENDHLLCMKYSNIRRSFIVFFVETCLAPKSNNVWRVDW